MNYNVHDRIGVKLEGQLKSGVITELDGFDAQILLDDGRRFTAEVNDLLAPDLPEDDGVMIPIFGNGRDRAVNDDKEFYFWLDRKHISVMTIDASLRIHYRLESEVTIHLGIVYRITKLISVFTSTFANLTGFTYKLNDEGFTATGGELEADGLADALLVPEYPAYRWNGLGLRFTVKNLASDVLALGAVIEGGYLYVEIANEAWATMYYRDDVTGDTLIEAIAIDTIVTPDDIVTFVDDSRMVTIYVNDVAVVEFTEPTPGKVKSSWGFWNSAAYNVDDFALVTRAVQVSSYPHGLGYNLVNLAYTPIGVSEELMNKLRDADSNA